MPGVEELALAKVNLDLCVTGRRADGYHELDSLVVFAEPADRLCFREDERLGLELGGPFAAALAGQADNLVLRAARGLAERAGRRPDAAIRLEKRIPVAGGLGGGSADAAATLRGLCRLWGLGLSLAELRPVALELGADVPVCLASRSARMRGIGERLEGIEGLPELRLLLVNPGRPLSTAEVFKGLDAIPRRTWPDAPPCGDWLAWSAARANHLEPSACRQVAPIGDIVRTLRRQKGCTLARMSGSGATCFGLFEDGDALAEAKTAIQSARPEWWVHASVTRGS